MTDTDRVEKVRAWFGSPAAAAKTLTWLVWASLLVAVIVGLIYALVLGVLWLFA